MTHRLLKLAMPTLACLAGLVVVLAAGASQDASISHVLLISIDGLHASDLDRFVAGYPETTLAKLSATGRTYTHASATKPSDSFPGMLAMVTGGTPRSTGVYYDDGWDWSAAAAGTATATCTAGTRVRWKQNLDFTPLAFTTFAGVADPKTDYSTFWTGPSGTTPPEWPLDASKLPRDPSVRC